LTRTKIKRILVLGPQKKKRGGEKRCSPRAKTAYLGTKPPLWFGGGGGGGGGGGEKKKKKKKKEKVDSPGDQMGSLGRTHGVLIQSRGKNGTRLITKVKSPRLPRIYYNPMGAKDRKPSQSF